MRQKKTACIILAAGNGTRMLSTTPKILHKIAHRTLIDHVLDLAEALHCEQIITVIQKNMDSLASYINNRSTVTFQKKALGTADAVKSALPLLNASCEQVIILYADTPLLTRHSLHNMLMKTEQNNSLCILGFTPKDPTGYGRLLLNTEGKLQRIIEHKDATPNEKNITLCNSGVMVATADCLKKHVPAIDNRNAKGEYYLTDLVIHINKAQENCSYIMGSSKEVAGINNRVQLANAEHIYQTRLRKSMMENGVTLLDPNSVYFSYDTSIEHDTIIHPHVFFGEHVTIRKHAEIRSFCHLEGCIIEEHTILGPFARVRPGSHIKKQTHIGNFVEIKNATLQEGSKVSHLSYIGDADIGKHTNIGAGTITCNYNGKEKNKTTIGEHAFIGSNSALIAPVSIGDHATIAAGSVINKNVENYQLGIARSKQSNFANWKKK